MQSVTAVGLAIRVRKRQCYDRHFGLSIMALPVQFNSLSHSISECKINDNPAMTPEPRERVLEDIHTLMSHQNLLVAAVHHCYISSATLVSALEEDIGHAWIQANGYDKHAAYSFMFK